MVAPTALMRDIELRLRAGGIESSASEARWVVEAATGDRVSSRNGAPPVSPEAAARAMAMVERRVGGEPLQYVTGVAGFRRLELAVGPGVLIPRPETEVLVEVALGKIPPRGVVVDVGTGSGAIALAIADERPDARVIATEASDEAMAWAVRNRDALGAPVELLNGDLLANLPDELRGDVDVLVANLPYVTYAERNVLPREVIEHEPRQALFGSGDLAEIPRLVTEARDVLRPEGWIVLEIGESLGAKVSAWLSGGGYREVDILPDLNGRDRIALGRRPAAR